MFLSRLYLNRPFVFVRLNTFSRLRPYRRTTLAFLPSPRPNFGWIDPTNTSTTIEDSQTHIPSRVQCALLKSTSRFRFARFVFCPRLIFFCCCCFLPLLLFLLLRPRRSPSRRLNSTISRSSRRSRYRTISRYSHRPASLSLLPRNSLAYRVLEIPYALSRRRRFSSSRHRRRFSSSSRFRPAETLSRYNPSPLL